MDIKYLSDYYKFTVFEKPLYQHIHNLTQTASGYGKKLTTRYMIRLRKNTIRRVYATCFSNAASYWVMIEGTRYYLRDCDI